MSGSNWATGLANGVNNAIGMYMATKRQNPGWDPLSGLLGGSTAPSGTAAPVGQVQQETLPAIPGAQSAAANSTPAATQAAQMPGLLNAQTMDAGLLNQMSLGMAQNGGLLNTSTMSPAALASYNTMRGIF